MNYLSLLTEDETRYICSIIPPKHTITYFQNYPNSFSKIIPGFRASAIARLDSGNILFRYRNQDFISSFIEKHISKWLPEIQEHIDKCMRDGDSKDLAYIHTLPLSFFADNVSLYFKLIGEEYPEAYTSYFKEQDHKDLEKTIVRYLGETRWIMTYDDCDLIHDIYKDYHMVEYSIRHNAGGSVLGKEIVITNIPESSFIW